MQGSERTQSWPGLLSGIVIALITGVSLMGIPAGTQGAGRATVSSTIIDSSDAVSAVLVNVTTQHQPGRSMRTAVSGDATLFNIESSSSGHALSTEQMGTIRASSNNPTRLALIASGVQGKTGHSALIGYLLGFQKR
jgi:hypothetical protein